MGYEEPTPIQVFCNTMVMGGADARRTGPDRNRLKQPPSAYLVELHRKGKKPFAIILEPTRELAVQVAQEMIKIGAKKISSYSRSTAACP